MLLSEVSDESISDDGMLLLISMKTWWKIYLVKKCKIDKYFENITVIKSDGGGRIPVYTNFYRIWCKETPTNIVHTILNGLYKDCTSQVLRVDFEHNFNKRYIPYLLRWSNWLLVLSQRPYSKGSWWSRRLLLQRVLSSRICTKHFDSFCACVNQLFCGWTVAIWKDENNREKNGSLQRLEE